MLDIIIINAAICGCVCLSGGFVIITKNVMQICCVKKHIPIIPNNITVPIERPTIVHMIHSIENE